MGSIWNHLARPLSYRDSNGEIRYLSPKDVVRVKNYVLCLLAAMVVKVVLSSKSLKSNILSTGFGTASVFYFVTAFFKILDKRARDASQRTADFPDLSKRCPDFESFGMAKREIGLDALADALADEQDRREDELRLPKWPHFESFGMAKREIGLDALADALADEQDRREDELRLPKWPHSSSIIDQKRDDQL